LLRDTEIHKGYTMETGELVLVKGYSSKGGSV
jgi:hypothetical protein